MHKNADFWINHLQLQAHPEGGYFREIYRSKGFIPQTALGTTYGGNRPYSTSIYFLLKSDNFSAFHRLASDEIWHFYEGSGIHIHCISPEGNYFIEKIGKQPEKEEVFQVVIPAFTWFAAEVPEIGAYGLVGCAVAPGFDFADFEMAQTEALQKKYPQHEGIIKRLCR
ncbi:MAG: cupin domain-containing protein [Bacteroidota bacterium]